MPDRILSKVLLPAPLRPIMPTTSPDLIWKETSWRAQIVSSSSAAPVAWPRSNLRSEEHTSELQSQSNLVCRLLLEKKKTYRTRPDLDVLIRDVAALGL